MYRDIRNYKYITTKDYKNLGEIKNNKIYINTLGINTEIEIEQQKTGFGYKVLFICPICGKRRTTLYLLYNDFICRECGHLGYEICNLYPKGIDIVNYKMNSIFQRLGVSEHGEKMMIVSILHCYYEGLEDARGIITKPKGMRYKTFEELLSRLWMLEKKRMTFINCLFTMAKLLMEKSKEPSNIKTIKVKKH